MTRSGLAPEPCPPCAPNSHYCPLCTPVPTLPTMCPSSYSAQCAPQFPPCPLCTPVLTLSSVHPSSHSCLLCTPVLTPAHCEPQFSCPLVYPNPLSCPLCIPFPTPALYEPQSLCPLYTSILTHAHCTPVLTHVHSTPILTPAHCVPQFQSWPPCTPVSALSAVSPGHLSFLQLNGHALGTCLPCTPPHAGPRPPCLLELLSHGDGTGQDGRGAGRDVSSPES